MNDIKNLPNASWVTPPSKNEKILRRAIETAIANGWDEHFHGLRTTYIDQNCEYIGFTHKYGNKWDMALEQVIYNKEFAKSLWGEDLIQLVRGNNIGQTISYHQPAWMVRLQDMVISDDPIAYLGSTLTKGVE